MPGNFRFPFTQGSNMKLRNKFIIILMILISQAIYALDMTGIIAYPVPFNPQKTKLKIGYAPPAVGSHLIKVAIHDINGDLVIKKTGNAFPVIWNGRNSSGKFVKPGLYIVKVEVDDDTGDYGKKVIRILVDY